MGAIAVDWIVDRHRRVSFCWRKRRNIDFQQLSGRKVGFIIAAIAVMASHQHDDRLELQWFNIEPH